MEINFVCCVFHALWIERTLDGQAAALEKIGFFGAVGIMMVAQGFAVLVE